MALHAICHGRIFLTKLFLNTFHNLYCFELEKSILEMERVGKKNKYICVESYRSEEEKANLLWQVTCESFYNTKEWNYGSRSVTIMEIIRLFFE